MRCIYSQSCTTFLCFQDEATPILAAWKEQDHKDTNHTQYSHTNVTCSGVRSHSTRHPRAPPPPPCTSTVLPLQCSSLTIALCLSSEKKETIHGCQVPLFSLQELTNRIIPGVVRELCLELCTFSRSSGTRSARRFFLSFFFGDQSTIYCRSVSRPKSAASYILHFPSSRASSGQSQTCHSALLSILWATRVGNNRRAIAAVGTTSVIRPVSMSHQCFQGPRCCAQARCCPLLPPVCFCLRHFW